MMPSYHNVPRQPFAGRSGNTMHSGRGGSKLKHVDSVRSLNDIALRDAAVPYCIKIRAHNCNTLPALVSGALCVAVRAVGLAPPLAFSPPRRLSRSCR